MRVRDFMWWVATVCIGAVIWFFVTLALISALKAQTNQDDQFSRGWQITVHLKEPDQYNRMWVTIGPKHSNRDICLAMLPALRERLVGVRSVVCQ